MSILLILLLLFLFVPLTVILSFFARIVSFFGMGKKRRGNDGYDVGPDRGDARKKSSKTGKKKKIFENDEGEYVDFEEIK